MTTKLQTRAIPAFNDNYIWAIDDGTHCVIVDPGDAQVVQTFLVQNQLQLAAILITHHHPDHVGGIEALLAAQPDADTISIYGPANEPIPGRTHALSGGETIDLPAPQCQFLVLSVPGHTLGHIAFYAANQPADSLFCGDTLFVGGCGRLFEGTPEQMYQSLQQLACLPDTTRVYCAHEYTLANLAFAQAAYPDNQHIQEQLEACQRQRNQGRATVPSTIGIEKNTNPFLLAATTPSDTAGKHFEGEPDQRDPVSRFALLRKWKDQF